MATMIERVDRAHHDKARRAVRHAILSGALIRPEVCENCGQSSRGSDGRSGIQGHHYRGYDNPLDVRWLCPKCHIAHDPRPSGESNGRSKLTLAQVREIRLRYKPHSHRYAAGGSAKSLAREFGISDRTLRRVVRNEIWPDPSYTATVQ